MPTLTEQAVPDILGQQLPTRTGNYQARNSIQPILVHDFNASLGDVVQLDRFPTFGERGMSKQQRERTSEQVIGTGASESVQKRVRQVRLAEFTGPSTTAGLASCLHITRKDMIYARRKLWQLVQQGQDEMGLKVFHESIGSMLLADDFARFDDRALVEELSRCQLKYNPGAKTDNAALNTDKFSTSDLRLIEEELNFRNTPKFPDGFYHALVDLRLLRHLREDPLFQQFAIAQIQSGVPNAPDQSTLIRGQGGGGGMATGMGPMNPGQVFTPIQYEGFIFYPSNTIPTRSISTANGPLLARLGFFFGPGSVGLAQGDRGPRIEDYGNTDYNRHWYYIWCQYSQTEYMLEDDQYSGAAIEARTYAP